jgi:hypothetical protein
LVSKKPTILVIAGTLIIAWLLVTSIHPIQPLVSSIGTTSNQQQQSSQQAPGSGTDNGNDNNGGEGGGSCWLCGLNFNIKFPDLFHFNWPSFNITWPNIKWPSIKWPNWGFGGGSGSGSGVGPETGDGTGNSNGGGGGGGSGSDNSIQSQTTTMHQVQPLFKIPTDVLIAIIVIITIIAGAFLVLRSKNTLLNRKKGDAQQLQEPEAVPPVLEVQNSSNPNAPNYAIQFEGDEMVSDFLGWGAQGGFLKPRINENLPLIWSLDDPLEIAAPVGTTVIFGKDTPVVTFPFQDGLISGSVTFKETCNVVHGLYQDMGDMKWIRAVRYDEDVMKLFRLNFLISSTEEENLYGALTPREIVNKIVAEKAELVKDQSALYPIARIFERAFYGRKMISREEYELYLISLSKALTSPKIIICGPKK